MKAKKQAESRDYERKCAAAKELADDALRHIESMEWDCYAEVYDALLRISEELGR